ncbi:MAG TPA: RES family NAD+ phosphorylase [Terracidiphilus sp.]|jgi:RES domain-containing protein|nr:RES family NAD+ phosphorylase [Terracidiphilus sp.]
MQFFRLFPARFRSTAFTGAGGLYAASRWNRLGTPMVYCASSPALAALEYFVNLEPNDAPGDLLMGAGSVPDALVETLSLDRLPRNWRALNNQACRDLGTEWAASNRSAALRVPSAVVDGDWNILLNPRHPGFAQIEIRTPRPFRYDERMFR